MTRAQEKIKLEQKPQSIDKEKRKARGLAHRRRGGKTNATDFQRDLVLISAECTAFFAGASHNVMAELRAKELALFSAARTPLFSVALAPGVEVSQRDGWLVVGETRLQFGAAEQTQEWHTLLRNLTVAKTEEEPKTVPADAPTLHDSLAEFESEQWTTKKADIAFEKLEGLPPHSADWLNRVLWRFFQEMATIELFEDYVGGKIILQLAKKVRKSRNEGKWPSFLDDISFRQLIKGSGFVKAHQIKLDQVDPDGTLLAEVDAEYSGGAGVIMQTRLLLPGILDRIFGSCPIEFRVQLMRIRATVWINMPRGFDEKFSLCFRKFPNPDLMDFDVECYVGPNRFPLACQADTLQNLAQSIVHRLMCHALVYPSSLCFFLPYPGRKPGAKFKKYLRPVDIEKRRAAKKKNANKPRPEVEPVPLSNKQISNAKKIEQRKKVSLEFFERILEQEDTGHLLSLVDEKVEVFGFSEGEFAHVIGVDPFKNALADLKRRFSEAHWMIQEETVVEEGVQIVWALEGVQIAKVFNTFPQAPPVRARFFGMAIFFFDWFGKIIGIEFYPG